MAQAKQTPNRNSKSKNRTHKSAAGNRSPANRPAAGEARAPVAPPRTRIPRPPALPRISSYAVSLLDRKSEGANLQAPPQRDWLTTSEASRLSGYSVRHIQNLCELGFFREGEEWKQRQPRPGVSRGGRILIKSSVIKKLDGLEE